MCYCTYVIGYNINTNKIYRLKGFSNLDYKSFKEDAKLKSVSNCRIENLDIRCLDKCYQRTYLKDEKCDCMIRCKDNTVITNY